MDEIDETTLWYQPNLDVFVNKWFSTYADAKESQLNEGGYLLPYQHHFYVCEAEVIRAMGLEPNDPDWESVGWDCVQPLDMPAYLRLHEKRVKAMQSS